MSSTRVLLFVPMRKVYLDNNATTPVDNAVLEAMTVYLTTSFGNSSSMHQYGQEARSGVDSAREQVSDLIGADSSEIVFTSGGTEADNLGVIGGALARESRGKHVITSRVEHPAVLKACEELESLGFQVTSLDVDRGGVIRLDQLEAALSEDTVLVSIMSANNETGVIQPIQKISRVLKRRDVLLHVDAVQSVGKVPLDVKELGVDLLSLSAHKFHGPKGAGALYVRSGLELVPRMLGGGQERSRRGGTTNVPGIVGLGKACAVANAGLEDFGTRVSRLRNELEEGILAAVPAAVVNGNTSRRMPHVSNLGFRGLSGESILVALDFEGVAVSTGAACSSGSVAPSHVLTAMALPEEQVNGAIRFSLSRMTEAEDISYAVEAVTRVVARMQEAASG